MISAEKSQVIFFEIQVIFLIEKRIFLKLLIIKTGANLGRADAPPPQGFDPCRSKGSPLCTILRSPYLVTDSKNFLKAPPYFKRGARAKKTIFCQNFLKSA